MGLYLQYAVESRGFGFQIDYAVQVYIYNERDCSSDPGLYALCIVPMGRKFDDTVS